MGRKKSIIRAGSKFYENIKLTAAHYDQNCEDECCSKLKVNSLLYWEVYKESRFFYILQKYNGTMSLRD